MELPSQIHNHAVRDTDEAVQGQMPSYSTTWKLIQRVRSRNDHAPAPDDLATLVVPEEYKYYRGGSRNLSRGGSSVFQGEIRKNSEIKRIRYVSLASDGQT
ncbi:Uncharacterised protein r2_g1819 [Pycnogonum litorale]